MADTRGCNCHGALTRAAAACWILPGGGSTQHSSWLAQFYPAGLPFPRGRGKKWCEKWVQVPLSCLHSEMLLPSLLVRGELCLLTSFLPLLPHSFQILFVALGKQMGLGVS